MPTKAHASKIKVVDSGRQGEKVFLNHGAYAVVYVPSWLILKHHFDWSNVPATLATMKEYFASAPFEDRPFRAQRCLYTLKTLHIYRRSVTGVYHYNKESRDLIEVTLKTLTRYLQDNPVVAWDWIVSWTEARALAKSYPHELIRLFRRLRSHRDTKRKPKPALSYFLDILSETAKEHNIDMESK